MNRIDIEKYVNSQISNAKVLGNKTATLFAKDEKTLERVLADMNISYITPRVGEFIIRIK